MSPRSLVMLCCCAVVALGGCDGAPSRARTEPAAPARDAATTQLATSSRPVRGHDPWVFRSVLDERPRMLTAALRPDLWVAYDAKHAALYRVWSDGVDLDGPVYNEHHGPQPRVRGEPFLTSAFAEPWHVVGGERDRRPAVQYGGHRFEAGHLALMYTLSLDDGTHIEIEELPEAVLLSNDEVALERTFRVGPLPPGEHVELDFNAVRLASEENVRIVDRTEGIRGRLVLGTGSTRWIMRFGAKPEATAERLTRELTPEGLIAASDCATCHNPTQKTIGPSFRQVAERYRTNANTIRGIARKIREGGAYEWGEVAMVAHPLLTRAQSEAIAEYILRTYDPSDARGKDVTHYLAEETRAPVEEDALIEGVTFELFELGHEGRALPRPTETALPRTRSIEPMLWLTETTPLLRGSAPRSDVLIRARGMLRVERDGDYDFYLQHDGVAQLSFRDDPILRDVAGEAFRDSTRATIRIVTGTHPFEVLYRPSGTGPRKLALIWQPPGGYQAAVPSTALRTTALASEPTSDRPIVYRLPEPPGGVGNRPLAGVHPSFDLHAAHPPDWKPMVGGMDFLPDGRLVVCTWDARGAVYVIDNPSAPDPSRVQVRKIADGLAEPLGLKVVDGTIYVLQKHELTQLVDRDGDGIIDDYRTVSDGWGVTPNFHEFAFGLAYKDGFFYATLATAVEPGGVAAAHQDPDRGSVIRIARETGAVERIATGLRTPNGIGFGPYGELFVTDNEGDWLPSSKLVHVTKGAFFGSRSVDPVGTRTLPVTPPLVWIPQDEIGNSPSQLAVLDAGLYRGQLIYGDVTYGGLNRVVVHPVSGVDQGCVLPFTQGLEAGVNRVVVAPDGSIYAGGIGNPGNWNQEHKNWYGLERLTFNGKATFELLDVEVQRDAIDLTFTEPVREGYGEDPLDYALTQWRYVPTAAYGGPKVGERPIAVRAVHISEDRRRVRLETGALEEGRVLRVSLTGAFVSSEDNELWAGQAWCTINALAPPAEDQPLLTSIARTRSPRDRAKSELPIERALGDFELSFEWRAKRQGMAALAYRIAPGAELSAPRLSLAAGDASAIEPTRRSGGAPGVVAPSFETTRPPGSRSQARIVVRDRDVQHWVDGRMVAQYVLPASTPRRGRLALLDDGAGIELRSVRVRELEPPQH